MEIKRLSLGDYAANCYIVLDTDSNECAVIDPGANSNIIKRTLDDMNIHNIKFILLTHGHADHTQAAVDIKNIYNAPIYINQEDYKMMESGSFMYGNIHKDIDKFIKDGDMLTLGNMNIKVIHTPGHTPGGVSFLIGDALFTGDTLFAGSIGRTDMLGGNFKTLIDSIKGKLMKLSDDIIVLPGHQGKSSIGNERENNPFL
ncbi:MBL fold metallo-hydrolase [Clostridium tyrobutyricum]|uniref:MBL fold metallo-hydrolase n=1 Tax=Clostridium tyrobutyricum TaxID=1519 RepID=UPI00073DA97A|nr:MBL fold metallo-hydrolase [Clostridium tyrobutyricum]MBV4415911.1 MBL fold metallo-hydrolase [Clostridium tyrobutyricum]MBV4437460.1 MBL fold metallo-hydrolase [Clostridium tyrobutyricum]